LQDAVLRFATTGRKVSRIADWRDLFLLGPDSILLRSTDGTAAASMMSSMLISEERCSCCSGVER
jgi:hypothetical protein